MNIEIPGYSIQGELGRGGMATVFLAQQTSLERRVALKVMVPALAADKAFTERFLREGRTVGKLTHPNIIKVFDTGQYQGHYYLAMEYLAGGTLKERMDRGLSPEESLTIIRAVADALAHAHHHGIVHRDIKPQNILFYPSGIPVLSDFGIAKALEGNADFTSFTSTYIGSPRYMSPEQVQGQRIDARADIYALGVLFYEMLTGRALYSATEPFALAYKHVSEPAPPLPAHLKAFQSIMDRLLAKEPDKRFASAEAFIHALDELGATMPPKSPGGATTIDIRRPPRRRHSRLWGAGAGAALLAAAGYAAWQWISGSATPPMPPAGPVAVVAESPTPSDAGSPPEIAPSAVAPLVPPPAPVVPVETPAPPASAAPAAPTLAEGRAGAATEASDNDPVDDDPGYPSVDPGIDQLVAEVEQTMARGDDALALAMVQAGLVAYPHAEILQVLAKTLEGRLAAPPPVAAVATEDRPGKPTQDNTPPPPPPPPPQGVEAQLNLSRSQRRQIQASLARRGFDPGPADGLLGPRSRRAIAAFQRTRGEEPTGYLNSTTGRALLEEAPPEGPGEVTPEPLATGSPDAETPPAVEPPPGDSDTATPPAPAPAPSPPAPRREVLLARIDALFVRGDYRGALAMARAALADNPNVSALGAWTRKLQQTLDRAEEANFRPSPPRSYQRDGAIQVQHAQCQQGDCINGKGVFNYSAGHIYKGEFRNAEPHGRGIYLDVTTGVRYVGDFHHGVAQGRGSYYYPNGTFYTGEVADNAPHGQGELHYPSGNVVVGQWQRGQPVGP